MADLDHLGDGEKPLETFYGNICVVCFKGDDLFLCPKCRVIRYCSEFCHKKDHRNHQRICVYLSERTIKTDDPCVFFCENLNFMADLERHMRLHHTKLPLTHFEKEVCLLPWVCVVCYSSVNVYPRCVVCRSVAYCSLEHEMQDRDNHERLCKRLYTSKTLISLGFQHQYKIEDHKYEYRSFREKEKNFPANRDDLLKLIRYRPRVGNDHTDIFNTNVFFDKYAAASTLINCLKTIGLINRRFYQWPPDKHLRLLPNTKNKYTGTLVIHVLLPEDYEFRLQWNQFIGLILDWLKNVSHVKVVFVGNELCYSQFLKLDRSNPFVTYEIHPRSYQDAEGCVERPDVVVLFNYGYPKLHSCKDFLKYQSLKDVFRYKNVPVIVTSLFHFFLNRIDERLKQYKMNVKCLQTLSFNPFANSQCLRFWDEKGLQVGHYNEFMCIYRKE